jgi:hypothetical protein
LHRIVSTSSGCVSQLLCVVSTIPHCPSFNFRNVHLQ